MQKCAHCHPHPWWFLVKALTKREVELNRDDEERIKFEEQGGMKMKDILGSKNTVKESKCVQNKVAVLLLIQGM